MYEHNHSYIQPYITYSHDYDPNIAHSNFQNLGNAINTVSYSKADRNYVENINQSVNCMQVNINELFAEINKMKERGKEEMMESIKIIQIYRDNRKAAIDKKYNAEFETLKKSNETMEEYRSLVNAFEASLMELYTSQFEEGQTETNVDKKELAILDLGENNYRYEINDNYYPEAAKALEDKKQVKVNELTQLCAEVSALLGICKTKEEVEDVLVNYSIMDKKTKKLNMIEV